MFCPECGTDHHLAERLEREAEKTETDREIELARINAKRDVEIARITAGAAKDVADAEATEEVAHAEGVVDGMHEVLEAQQPPAPEPEADPAPVVLNAPIVDAPVDEHEDAPPVADAREQSEPKKAGLGMWG
jgi:cell envelope opacity-associated protein A